MRSRRNHGGVRLVRALILTFFVVLLARPDRIWSSAPPRLDDESRQHLNQLALPAFALPDSTLTDELEERICDLNGYTCFTGEIQRGENLALVLQSAGATPTQAYTFIRELKKVFDPRRARPGDQYRVWLDREHQILKFEYRQSPVEIYRAVLEGAGWAVEKVEVPIERRQATIAGVLSGSLWESFMRAGADPDLVMAFVELFGWDVDFAHESQQGDEFRAVYEVLYADGRPIGNGRILAASYKDRDETHMAVYFTSDETRGYYDPDGNSVRKSFLRSPLNFTRVSSRFSYARKHPITKKVQPHMGVDYAAPTGTPVWAVADGTVVEAVNKGANGKMIRLRHAMGYETYYLHLSGYARGVRRGAKVTQGQTIGYVGSSGRSTGPHLDYRVKKKGTWVNPLREKYKPGPPVPEELKDAYQVWATLWLDRLADLPLTEDVAEAQQ